MATVDVIVVSLGGTHGLREADTELAASLERAGARVEVVATHPPREVRTLALTDLAWARAARRAAAAAPEARAVLYSSVTAALLWPRPGAIRFDAVAAGNRPGRHGIWQRPLERRRLRAASLLVPWSEGALLEAPWPHAEAIVVPVPVEPSGQPVHRDLAAVAYGANPEKKGLDRVLAAWATVGGGARAAGEAPRSGGLVVAGVTRAEVARKLGERAAATRGVEFAGPLAREEFRALVRRARAYVTAPRREDHGIAQLEALADGTPLVTTPAPGPYAALPLAEALDPRLVSEDLAAALRTALEDPLPGYAEAARAATAPLARAAVDRVVSEQLLPALLRDSAG